MTECMQAACAQSIREREAEMHGRMLMMQADMQRERERGALELQASLQAVGARARVEFQESEASVHARPQAFEHGIVEADRAQSRIAVRQKHNSMQAGLQDSLAAYGGHFEEQLAHERRRSEEYEVALD
ncbi:unnamed protein product [Prorocentrum cordatum]|uniref:Uncharacterized protein n=1 Tax=Prorocentrum cordatum TaxID=2364126 RepID=A0ABN9QZE5_9DINO|nr:unnamed protein product [Polarella glacialis]